MKALELYKFVQKNKLEYHHVTIDSQADVILFVPFDILAEFQNLLGVTFLANRITKGVLKSDCMAFQMVDICDYFDIGVFDVFDNEND